MTAEFNPTFRSKYENVIKKNVIHNPRDKFEYLPERYGPEVEPQRLIGGGRVRELALSSENGHYPSIDAVEHSDMGGFYGRAKHPMRVGSGRKYGGIGVIKHAHRVEPYVNEMDMNYIGGAHSFQPHVTGRAPRLTKAIKQQILEAHPELMEHHLSGGKIDWSGIWKEIKKGMGYVNKGAKVIGSIAKHPITRKALEYATGEDYGDVLDTLGEGAQYAHDISGLVHGMGRKKHMSHMSHMHGKGFWKDFGEGFKKGFKGTAKVVSKVAPVAALLAPEFAPAIGAVGLASGAVDQLMGGRHRRRYGGASSGGMSMHRKKSVGHAKNQARGALIRQIMREKGCTLGQASSYIKQHNIPF